MPYVCLQQPLRRGHQEKQHTLRDPEHELATGPRKPSQQRLHFQVAAASTSQPLPSRALCTWELAAMEPERKGFPTRGCGPLSPGTSPRMMPHWLWLIIEPSREATLGKEKPAKAQSLQEVKASLLPKRPPKSAGILGTSTELCGSRMGHWASRRLSAGQWSDLPEGTSPAAALSSLGFCSLLPAINKPFAAAERGMLASLAAPVAFRQRFNQQQTASVSSPALRVLLWLGPGAMSEQPAGPHRPGGAWGCHHPRTGPRPTPVQTGTRGHPLPTAMPQALRTRGAWFQGPPRHPPSC